MSKMSRFLATALVLVIPILSVQPALSAEAKPAEADLGTLLQTIRANRRALVAVNLNLTEEQSAKFWPLFDRYEQEMNVIGNRMAALIEDYITHFNELSDAKALQLVQDYMAAEADRLKLRRSYIDEFAKILPGRTVARFFQIENKMDAVVRYDLAATIPVVEQQASAAGK